MPARLATVATLVTLAGAALVSACSIGSPTHLIYNAGDDDDDDTATTTSASLTCDSPFVTPDLSTLTACGATAGGTGGHCYDADKVPTMGTLPATCSGTQVCVPDSILEAGGTTALETCTSVIGKPGACVSDFIAEIDKEKAQLGQDVCATGESCVPCVNPLDNLATPFCQRIGVHQDACGAAEAGASMPAATTPQLCCPTEGAPPQGVCLQGDDIPASQRGKVGQNVCPPDYSCVPSSFTNNDPVACSSAEGSGFCVDECFTGYLGDRALLQGSCPGPRDKCVPCLVGKGEGLPGCQ
jgi:hypothetical protein